MAVTESHPFVGYASLATDYPIAVWPSQPSRMTARETSEIRMRRSELYSRLYEITTFFVSLNGKPAGGTALVSTCWTQTCKQLKVIFVKYYPYLPLCRPSINCNQSSVPVLLAHFRVLTSSPVHPCPWILLVTPRSPPRALHYFFNRSKYSCYKHAFVMVVFFYSTSRHWLSTY